MALDGRVMGDLLETELLKTPNKANVVTVLSAPFSAFPFVKKSIEEFSVSFIKKWKNSTKKAERTRLRRRFLQIVDIFDKLPYFAELMLRVSDLIEKGNLNSLIDRVSP